jgi:hypothetical protein
MKAKEMLCSIISVYIILEIISFCRIFMNVYIIYLVVSLRMDELLRYKLIKG